MLAALQEPTGTMTSERPSPFLLTLSFATVYLVWGSNFATTKFLVGVLPPFLAGGARFLSAGALLLAFACWRGMALPRALADWRHFAVMGILQVVLSAGLNMFAMRHVASNQSALLNASAALWIPILGSFGARGHALSLRVSIGIGIGFLGLAFLLWPHGGFSIQHFGWQLLILLACFSWAVGTVYFRRMRLTVPMVMYSACNMLIGGAILIILGVGLGETERWRWTGPSLAALAYLTLFGACFAYTAFSYLMRHTTPVRLSTYAYVNPAIAAAIGWLLLGETMSTTQLIGMGVILAGVVLVSLPDPSAEQREPVSAVPTEPTG
jgi:drug/metabolite transporter (DMT)-like permease